MAKTIQTNIVINAHANGLSEIGNTLTELSSMLSGISEELVGFGRDSLGVYQDYETNMTAAGTALSQKYGQETSKLKQVMADLDEAATNWAATTIFHTDDVSNAIMLAAKASWDYDQIMSGIPAAMKLAQAGGIDLSEAIDYVTTSMYALDMKPEEIGDFIDLWAYAADAAPTNIDQVGKAMQKMGRTMTFAENEEEILTMLDAIALAGTTGEAAGTLLRNSMLRLVAPTDKAVAAMSQLELESGEMESIMSEVEAAGLGETLEQIGFSAYTSEGKLKPMKQTFEELAQALLQLNGGDLDTLFDNERVNSIMKDIFPTRTITGAQALIKAAASDWNGLYDAMTGGAAKGYAEYGAERQMNTLWGSAQTFYSKMERLQQVTGENLAPQMERFYTAIGGIIDKIAEMDDTAFTAFVGSLEGIAGVSGGLMLAGTALRIIANPFAKYALAAAAIGAVAGAVANLVIHFQELDKTRFEESLGGMELDHTPIRRYFEQIDEAYKTAYSDVRQYNNLLTQSFTSFDQKSSELSSSLVSNMLTKMEIKPEDQKDLIALGNDLAGYLTQGIESNYSAMMTSMYQAFGGDEAVNNPTWLQIMDVMAAGYDQEIGQAENLSKQLREAMTSAFADGQLTGQEVANIQSIINQMNELLAQQVDRQNYQEQQRLLRKSQTVSLGELGTLTEEATAHRDAILDELENEFAGALYDANYWYDWAIENGQKVNIYDDNGRVIGRATATEQIKQAAIKQLTRAQESERMKYSADYNNFLLDLFENAALGSDFADSYLDLAQAGKNYGLGFTKSSKWLDDFWPIFMDALGGIEEVNKLAQYYDENGFTDLAKRYEEIGYMNKAFEGGASAVATPGAETYLSGNLQERIENFLAQQTSVTLDEIANNLDYLSQSGMSGLGENANDIIAGLNSIAQGSGYDNATEMIIDIKGNTDPLQEDIEAQDDQTLVENVDGVDIGLASLIDEQDGRVVTTYVTATTVGGAPLIGFGGSSGGDWVTETYAEGGRATEASIFGENGAEWAIPEEHSQRTAELLNAARAASGFTWPDLLSRYGGLNANANNQSTTLVYSPTINAGNASGVEQVLAADKTRFEKWWEDRRTRDAVEVYA